MTKVVEFRKHWLLNGKYGDVTYVIHFSLNNEGLSFSQVEASASHFLLNSKIDYKVQFYVQGVSLPDRQSLRVDSRDEDKHY